MQKRGAGPDSRESANAVFASGALEEKPIWSGLYESVRDAMFPARLPPLELTSTPIPVADRMAAKTNPWAVGTSTLVNGGILVAVILLGLKVTSGHFADPAPHGRIDLSDLKLPVLAKGNQSGGNGGSHDLIDPLVGRPPKIELNPIVPPQVAIIDHPKLVVDSAIPAPPDVTIPDSSNLPNVGVAKSPNVSLSSNGPGGPAGIGWQNGDGVGPGSGPGWGPGSEPGVYIPGRGGVTAPAPIFAPEAEFSDEARRQKYQGICLVGLIVDAHGLPQNIHVVQRLGMGLDEKAIEAIRRYRFKPATKDGKPVAAAIVVEVDFRLF
jgi:periplasmic protein TonB